MGPDRADHDKRRRAEALDRLRAGDVAAWRRLAGVLEHADDAIITVSVEGVITDWNRAAQCLYGYSSGEAIGQNVAMLTPPGHSDEVPGILARIIRGEKVDHYETVRQHRKGSVLHVSLALSPVVEPSGEVSGAAMICRDVTERRRAELEREREASQRLREVDRLRSDFLSTVSHELRTPLTSIKGFSRLLSDQSARIEEEDKAELIERIAVSADRLDYLIDDLLDFFRLERGLLKVLPEALGLAALVTSAVERVGAAVEQNTVVTDVADGFSVFADPMALSRVLENLLSNAAKFSDSGSTITVSARRTATTAAITVADQGAGIPAEELDRIFDRFYRVGGADNRKPGTGIGLAIVKEFTEAQGGQVSVQSAVGRGAEFTVTLPLAT